jgi:MFS transporter, ACS family, D-galactonate transporter
MPPSTDLNQQIRWRTPVVLAVTVLINYLDWNNLSLAIPRLAQEFGWSDREVGSKGEHCGRRVDGIRRAVCAGADDSILTS